jgi:uncharacterized protein YtpQ (UPF0354 family)
VRERIAIVDAEAILPTRSDGKRLVFKERTYDTNVYYSIAVQKTRGILAKNWNQRQLAHATPFTFTCFGLTTDLTDFTDEDGTAAPWLIGQRPGGTHSSTVQSVVDFRIVRR